MTVPSIVIRPDLATQAYAATDRGVAMPGQDTGFSATLQRALGGVVDASNGAEAQAMQALSGHADITNVVTAVSKAELALQTTMAIRDRVVQAYQDIMKMPI